MNKNFIEKIWLTDEAIWIRTNDGKQAYELFASYPRLKKATRTQRANYRTSFFGLHWPDLDEDLSFDGFFSPKNPKNLQLQ